jgi:hypothetical protein
MVTCLDFLKNGFDFKRITVIIPGLNRWGYFVQARVLSHQIMVTCLDFLKNGFDFKDFDFKDFDFKGFDFKRILLHGDI